MKWETWVDETGLRGTREPKKGAQRSPRTARRRPKDGPVARTTFTQKVVNRKGRSKRPKKAEREGQGAHKGAEESTDRVHRKNMRKINCFRRRTYYANSIQKAKSINSPPKMV